MKKIFWTVIILLSISMTFTSCEDAVRISSEGGTTNTGLEGSILYASLVSGKWSIFIMNADGSSKSAITEAGGNHVKGIAWSPDNEWIIFSSNASGAYEIYKVKRNSSLFTQITFDGSSWYGVGNVYPCWINANEILYTTCRVDAGQKEIVRVNANGSGLDKLSNVHFIISNYQFPCLAGPSRLIFSKGDVGSPASSTVWIADYPCFGNQVLVADVDGSNSGDFYPDYYSDKIVFSSGNGNIYIVNSSGSNLTDISMVQNVVDKEPHFSPKGSQVAFISNQSGVDNIWVMNIDGSNRIQLTNNSQPNSIESLDW
ncbi:MAG: PD40 domain-containing protein [Ignavibacteria bacterium]|nr:PD40 domain-containing protein [Ignavibacteria bacterium]